MNRVLLTGLSVTILMFNACHEHAFAQGSLLQPRYESNTRLSGSGRDTGAGKTVQVVRNPDQLVTTLEVDLVMNEATQGLESQTWGRVFDSLGQRVRVRTGNLSEDESITEVTRGMLRTVRLVGRVDRKGVLTFPGKTFRTGSEKELRQWLDELKAYGAQGAPEGKPRWGLSTAQFQDFFVLLGKPVEQDLSGQPLIDAIRTLGFGQEIALRVEGAAQEVWNNQAEPLTVTQDVKGISRGSALAVLLSDQGLCVRPLRTPSGQIDLVVRTLAETPDPWPCGWEPRDDVQRSDYAPTLFSIQPIGFLERPVSETLAAAREKAAIPVVVDYASTERLKVDLNVVRFGQVERKTAWVLVLKNCLLKTGLAPHLRIDEAGRCFVYIAPHGARATPNQK